MTFYSQNSKFPLIDMRFTTEKKNVMNIKANLFHIIILLIALMMTGCSFNNVYKIDGENVDRSTSTKTIQGISDLYISGAKNVNIMFIHGMGYNPIEKDTAPGGVTDKYQNRIAKELGFSNEIILTLEESVHELKLNDFQVGTLKWRKFEKKDKR